MRGHHDDGNADRDGDRDRLPDLLHRSVRAMRHEWADAMSEWDISPHQARALSVVSGRHGDNQAAGRGPRLSEIAERLRIAPRSATEVVDGLEELGLVERVPDPDDRRATCVRLTTKGTTVQREIWSARAGTDNAFFGRLADDERVELTRLLRKLLAVDGHGANSVDSQQT